MYPVLQNLSIASYSERPSNAIVNLQDPAYGLDTAGPMKIKDALGGYHYNGTYNLSRNGDSSINEVLNATQLIKTIQSRYEDNTPVSTAQIPMGKFSYTGHNYYWVTQQFYYQLGGVFLNQNLTQGGVSKLLPLITLGVTPNRTPSVSITNLILDGQNGTVSGSTSIQTSSRISRIRRGIISDGLSHLDYYISPTLNNNVPTWENARSVTITIGNLPTTEQQMWKNSFDSIVYSANVTSGFQSEWATSTINNGNVIFQINGPGQSWNDIALDYAEVGANVVLQPVGWQGT